MALKDFFKKKEEKNERLKEALEARRIQKLVEAREKNSNEREFDRFVEEERQKRIKEGLEKFRERRKQEVANMSVLKGKNIFKGHNNLLKEKHLFGFDGRGSMNLNGGMFFN